MGQADRPRADPGAELREDRVGEAIRGGRDPGGNVELDRREGEQPCSVTSGGIACPTCEELDEKS